MNSRARQLWLGVGCTLVLLVIVLSLAPISVPVPVEEGDKVAIVNLQVSPEPVGAIGEPSQRVLQAEV